MYIILCMPLRKKKYGQNHNQNFLIAQNFCITLLEKIILDIEDIVLHQFCACIKYTYICKINWLMHA